MVYPLSALAFENDCVVAYHTILIADSATFIELQKRTGRFNFGAGPFPLSGTCEKVEKCLRPFRRNNNQTLVSG
jgi:hypothetical protein